MKRSLISLACSFLVLLTHAQQQELKPVDPTQYKLLSHSTKFKSSDGVLVSMFDETGRYLLVGGLEKSIVCYDLASGEERWKVAGNTIEVASSADMYSLDVPFLAVGNNMFAGGEIHVYNWQTGENVGGLSPFARGMHSMTYAPSGVLFWFAPGGNLFGYSIVNNAFVTPLSGLSGHSNVGHSVRIGPYENVYSVGVDKQFIKWKSRYDEIAKTVVYEGEKEVIFTAQNALMSIGLNKYIRNSEDAKLGKIYAAVGENRGLVRIFDLKNSTSPIQTFQVPDGYAGNLNFHSTDPNLLIITGKQSVILYDFKSNKVLRTINMPAEIRSFDMTIDGTKWAVGLANGEVQVYTF
jgi:WD40 repeat protein